MEWLRNAGGSLRTVDSLKTSAARVLGKLAAMSVLLSSAAHAGLPESGIYTLSDGGRGAVIEYQNGKVAVSVFAYNEITGAPEWYIASGTLRDDGVEAGHQEPPLISGGYWPIHWMVADLLRPKNGMCVVCGTPQRLPEFERVGVLELSIDYLGDPHLIIYMAAQTDSPVSGYTSKRLNFGHANLALSALPADLKGEWVFLDKADPAKPAERYRFGEGVVVDRSREASFPRPPRSVYTLTYQDAARNATLHCMHQLRQLPTSLMPNPTGDGCELRIDGVARYSMLTYDIGLNRIQAFRGPMPPAEGPLLRGPLDIVAIRVE